MTTNKIRALGDLQYAVPLATASAAGGAIAVPPERPLPACRALAGEFKSRTVVAYEFEMLPEAEISMPMARVMAAAPDLLAALKTLQAVWDESGLKPCAEDDCACIDHVVRAAIAKAEGRDAP